MIRLTRAGAILALALTLPAGRTMAQSAAAPHTLVLRGEQLARSKALVAAKDAAVWPAYQRLRKDADRELVAPIVAVTDKRTLLPPSGDKHDYFSLSPYWWPDPAKADGLPYIRRDGETNPESKKDLDRPRLGAMVDNVNALALAYYLSGDERYAARAGKQLRAWFLDSATLMNPNLHFSQLVRGNPEERGSGIIDTHNFVDVVDASILLQGSTGWSSADEQGLKRWMGRYLAWLRDTPNGKHEHDAKNNHGSWYATQTATLALFTGDTALTRSITNDAKARIGWQIKPDGQQPIELERTKSMHYSGFNADALSRLAELGRLVGVDLWHYEAPEGGSLRKALNHLAEYLPDPKAWPGTQIEPVESAFLVEVLRRAQVAFGSPIYAPVFAKLDRTTVTSERSALLYPAP
jgi:hypothetical protein